MKIRMQPGSGVAVIMAAAAMCISLAASATTASSAWIARFNLPEQSPWQPGFPSGFHFNDGPAITSGILNGTHITVDLCASLGSVFGNVEGRVTANYADELAAPGLLSVNLGFDGITDESRIETRIGIRGALTGALIVDTGIIFPDIVLPAAFATVDAQLASNTDFTSSAAMAGKADFELGGLGVDADIAVASAGSGFYFGITRDVIFRQQSFDARVTAGHLGSGKEVTGFARVASSTAIDLYLDTPGYWQLTVHDLSLSNGFSHDIGIDIEGTAFAKVLGIGPSLGISAGFDVFESTPFPLSFDDIDVLGQFVVHVVPLPPALLLLGSAALGLA